MTKPVRLDKFLCSQGIGSRTEVKHYIKKGFVTVDGVVVKDSAYKVDTNKEIVCYNNEPIVYELYVYLMLNKPKGVVSATKDSHDTTVIDIIDHPQKHKLFPIGRLDKDTTGLLVMTNDGEMAHRLLSPKKHVPKTYIALVEGIVTEAIVCQFEEGIVLDDGYKTMPSQLVIESIDDGRTKVQVTICEGKFHQIKRMFLAVDMKVLELSRVSMGKLELDIELAEGEYRKLTKDELQRLNKG